MNNTPGILDFLCATLGKALPSNDPVTPHQSLVDLGFDSLTLVSIIAQIEAVYDVELPSEEVAGLLIAPSVKDLAIALDSAINQQQLARQAAVAMVDSPGK